VVRWLRTEGYTAFSSFTHLPTLPLPDPLQPEARTLLIPTHARAHGSVGTVAVFLIPIPFFAFTESRVCHTMGSHLGEIFGGVRAAE
jgi:hypothetical protein